jgi:hypothetical protein
MQDVFEPTANFGEEVFEPTANFGGLKSKLERRKKGLEKLKNILNSNGLSNTQKQKVSLAVSTGGVFAGLYLASRLLGNNKKSRFEGEDNFTGEVFEPMDFDGDYSNFAVDPNAIIQGVTATVGLIGSASQNKASKDANKIPLQREIDAVCGTKQKFLFKGKRNAYSDCKNRVIAKSDKEKQTNVDLANKQFDITKISLQTANADKEAERKRKSKSNLILGASIGGGVLVLGTILFFVLRKK